MARSNQEAQGTTHGADESEYDVAVSAWESVLGDDDEAEETQKPTAKTRPRAEREEPETEEEAPAEEAEEDPEDDGEEDPGEEDDDSEEYDDDQDEDDDEGEQPSQTLDPETKVKIKVNGEEQEVTLAELQQGYSRNEDYTRKTQAVANERREVESEKDQVMAQQQQWAAALQEMGKRLEATASGRSQAQWDDLKRSDYDTYLEERDKDRVLQERLGAVKSEEDRVQQEYSQHQQKQLQRFAAEENEKLDLAIPDWQDAQAKQRDLSSMAKYGKEVGFTEQELAGLLDHRTLLVLRDAAKFRELQAKKGAPAAKSKIRQAKARTLDAGKPNTEAPRKTKARKASQTLAKSRTVSAAVPYFDNMLQDEERR